MSLLRYIIIGLLFLSSTLYASVGKIALLKGEAFLERGVQKIALNNGFILEEKDTIRTSKEAQIQIIFEDKTVITLGSESILSIEEYLNDANKPKAKFKFGEGTFKTITGQIGKTAPENFTMETKTATIGIRGTTVQGSIGTKGDTIACLSGTITVAAIGSPTLVVVPSGKSTFVAPGTPPTPPQNIPSKTTGATPPPNENPPPIQDLITGVANNDKNNNLREKIDATSEASNNSHKGFVASYFTNPTNAAFEQTIGKAIKTSLGENSFEITSDAERVIPSTGNYAASFYTKPTSFIANGGTLIADTEFQGIAPASINNFTIYPENTAALITNAEMQIWYDPQKEIIISKITDQANTYQQISFAGAKSKTLPSSDLLYYKNVDALFFNQSSTNLAGLYNDVLVINPHNKKTLSLLMDGEAVGIGIGELYSGASIDAHHYIVHYNAMGDITKTNFEEMDGAIYGTNNQAVALFGISKSVEQINNSGYSYPTQYLIANGIAFKDTVAYSAPSNPYADQAILEGMTTKQPLDGTVVTPSTLTISLNKNAGTLSVASTQLTIDATHSAYVHDNYFATLSTATYNGTSVLKDYLIAVPYNAGNDYVSWGYWGQNAYQTGTNPNMTTSTTPFSTWVAGIKTPTDVIQTFRDANANYTYSGKVIGSALKSDGTIGYILNDATNAVNLAISFGSVGVINGSINFKTTLDSSTWTANSFTLSSFNNTGFSGALSNGNISGGSIKGSFFGPSAQSVAGVFDASKGAINVVGAFKAKR